MSFYTFSKNMYMIFYVKFDPYPSFNQTQLNKNKNLISDVASIFSIPDRRGGTLIKGINKFKDYPKLNKIIGTGWYSSRITINLDKSEIKPGNLNDKKVAWPPAIIAYVLDTGIIGVIFPIYFFILNMIFILKSNNELLDRIFYVILLGLAYLNVFIGYPLVNIAYILFLLPDGIINSRAKT